MKTIKWTLDPTHSELLFKVRHLMISNVTGSFKSFNVATETSDEEMSDAKINVTINAASVDTNNEQREGHLKSPDFFDVEKYPEIKFVATSFKKVSGSDFELKGNLTIKETTKEVKLDAEFLGLNKDPYGNIKAGFAVTGKINRLDFGLTWNVPLEKGGVLVSEDVKISSEIQMVKQA